jgi:hypothetical protein
VTKVSGEDIEMDLNQIENELIVQHCDHQTRHPTSAGRHQQQQQ